MTRYLVQILFSFLFFSSLFLSSFSFSLSPDTKPSLTLESNDSSVDLVESSPASSADLHFDLKDCVTMAMKNHPEIRAAQYDLDESVWKLREAQPRGIPIVTYEYEAAPAPKDASNVIESFAKGDITLLNRMKFGVGIPVTSFGKISSAQTLARLGIEASTEKKNQKVNEIALKVKQLYYGVLLARELKAMFIDAEGKLGKEITKRESEAQTADLVELARLKLTRYEILKRLREATRKEQIAMEGLRLQIGLRGGSSFDLVDSSLEPVGFELKEFSYYAEESKRYRPETKLLDIGIKAKEAEYRLEKRKLAPNLGVGGFFELGRTSAEVRNVETKNDFNDPFNFTRAGVGLRLKGELNLKEARAKIKQKEAQFFKISATKDFAEEGLELDLKDSYLNLQQTQADLEDAEKAYRLARQLVFLTKTNYEVGVGEKKDYVDSLQAFLLMKGRFLESVFSYNVAVATLIGKLGYQP